MSAIAEPELPATFTFAEAEDRGLSRRRLQRLRATGAVERIGRGLYRRTDEELVDHDLIEVAAKAHQPTLCLVSALARHWRCKRKPRLLAVRRSSICGCMRSRDFS